MSFIISPWVYVACMDYPYHALEGTYSERGKWAHVTGCLDSYLVLPADHGTM